MGGVYQRSGGPPRAHPCYRRLLWWLEPLSTIQNTPAGRGVYAIIGRMAKPPSESTKTSLRQRLTEHARTRWSDLAAVTVRYRSTFAYIDGHLPLCRPRCGGYVNLWGSAIYLAGKNGYQDSFLPSGHTASTAEDTLDCACDLYLNDPTAPLPNRPPTN